jgi:hypothetical protein
MKDGLRNLNVGGTDSVTGASAVQVIEKWNCFDTMHCVAECEWDSDVIVNEEGRIFTSQLVLESM